MKKVNKFDGLVHTDEGRLHAPDGNKVDGANLHA
jgi:hypothetical protein